MAHLEENRRRSSLQLALPIRRLSLALPRLRPGNWLPALIALALLGAWEAAARLGLISPLLFPAPSVILGYLARPAVLGELAGHAGATFGRVLLAVILGSLPGLLLGMLLGWSRPLHAALGPLLAAAHPVPKIAILPLIMIVFGIGDASIVVTAALGAFFPVLINTLAGVQQINPIHFDVARNYGAGRLKMFARVVLPGSLPLVLTGLLLALNVTLLMTLAVEMVSAREGLGAMIWQAWHTMRTEELYASLAVITVSGVLINSLFHRLARALAPWQAGAKGRLS